MHACLGLMINLYFARRSGFREVDNLGRIRYKEVAIASAQQLGYVELRPQQLVVECSSFQAAGILCNTSNWIRMQSLILVAFVCII